MPLHKSRKFGWYSCEYNSCPQPEPHWKLCPGICGKKFAPKRWRRNQNWVYVNNSPHKRECKERVYMGFVNVLTNFCFVKYDPAWYTCEHSKCPKSSFHMKNYTSTLSPSNNSYTASAGGTHTATLSVPLGYREIYWYVKSPSQSGLGTSAPRVLGNGSSTTASHTYSFPRGVTGDYVLTAYIYLSNGTIEQPSYTVTVR